MNALLLYPFILVAGALQAAGSSMNARLRVGLVNPWLAAAVSFALIVFVAVTLVLVMPTPLPGRAVPAANSGSPRRTAKAKTSPRVMPQAWSAAFARRPSERVATLRHLGKPTLVGRLHVDGRHLSRRRTLPQAADQVAKHPSRPLQDRLDRPVLAINDPAAYVERDRLVPGEGPIADALDEACDADRDGAFSPFHTRP